MSAPIHTYTNSSTSPLYNSRLLKNYIEYIRNFHPDLDIASLLRLAGINSYEIEDQGHWFSQDEVDRFHGILVQKTQNPNISREVGRFAASPKGTGAVRQYVLGFMSPGAAYRVLEKLSPHLTHATRLKTKRLGSNSMEVLVLQNPGVLERPYQCDNRIGIFEAISKLFTKKFAKIEHDECLHKGGQLCRYVITWKETSSSMWRGIRNYLIFFSFLVCLALHFLVPAISWTSVVLLFILSITGLSLYFERFERENLTQNMESQQETSKLLLDQIDIRYRDALLVREIGQATSMLLDTRQLLVAVIDALEKQSEFDRGGIWLANARCTKLKYQVGYGYRPEIKEILERTEFSLEKPDSKGLAVKSFKLQEPYLVNDTSEIEKDLSKRSVEFIKIIGSQSFICVPIVYEGESLGILLVDNIRSKRPLGKSDISLLMGIAPQIATSIHNAMSYQALQESREREKNLRILFEKYVPAPVIKRYVDSKEVDLFRGEELSISVLFLDIRGFTASAESMAAIEVVSFLNDFFEKCCQIISEESGHINKYTGDGLFAIFGAPEPLAHHTHLAFNAACRILEMSRNVIINGKPMEIGIGLNTGNAILGNIGSRTKIEYTAIGDTINTADRLQDFTKLFQDYPVIMSRSAWKELKRHPSHSAIAGLGLHKIRGKKERIAAFGYNPLKHLPLPIPQKKQMRSGLRVIKG